MERAKRERKILHLALLAGQILLENGADIFRVEDTVYRICHHYHLNTVNVFVLSNGIFLTAGDEEETQFAKVEHIPVNRANLTKVTEVNQLSRAIQNDLCSLEEVERELNRIQALPGFPKLVQILAGSIGAACFCYLFGGNAPDTLCSLFIGAFFYLYQLYIGCHFSKIISNLAGSCWITILCLLCYKLHLGMNFDAMMIGSLILMIPGVPFTNGIRDIGNGDYIAGSVRMLDALLVFFCIAIGVCLVLTLYQSLTGGAFVWI